MINFALRNTSLFNTSHSINILPGPVNKRLVHIAINSNVSSYPPTKPWDNPTIRVIYLSILSFILEICGILGTSTANAIPTKAMK